MGKKSCCLFVVLSAHAGDSPTSLPVYVVGTKELELLKSKNKTICASSFQFNWMEVDLHCKVYLLTYVLLVMAPKWRRLIGKDQWFFSFLGFD